MARSHNFILSLLCFSGLVKNGLAFWTAAPEMAQRPSRVRTTLDPESVLIIKRTTMNDHLMVSSSQRMDLSTEQRKLFILLRQRLGILRESPSSLPTVSLPSTAILRSKTRRWLSLTRRFAWTFPLLLCLIPPFNCMATTSIGFPEWWKMVDLSHLWSKSSTACTFFLLSNIAYGASGFVLYKTFPMEKRIGNSSVSDGSGGRLNSLGWAWSHYTWLSFWLLGAGIISATFHAIQTVADYTLAESWCFLDHGIALSAFLYFWTHCGAPRLPTLIPGTLGVVCLCNPVPAAYELTHSAWHVLSAVAALAWGLQGRDQRRYQLERAFISKGLQQQAT